MTEEDQNTIEKNTHHVIPSEASEAGEAEGSRDLSAPSDQGSDSGRDDTDKKTEPAYKSKLVNFDELKPGQTVKLHERIKDISAKGTERERVQIFEGIILGIKGAGISRTLTIRKISTGGYAVEKIFPINSPVVAKIELVKSAKVRRAKLGFLKNVKRRFKRKLKETQA